MFFFLVQLLLYLLIDVSALSLSHTHTYIHSNENMFVHGFLFPCQDCLTPPPPHLFNLQYDKTNSV